MDCLAGCCEPSDPGGQITCCDPIAAIFGIIFASGCGFSPGSPISSTNKTDGYDIAAILLKVALHTIKPI
jgi:hypothetical protein